MRRLAACLICFAATGCMGSSPASSKKAPGLVDGGRTISLVDGADEVDAYRPTLPGYEASAPPAGKDQGVQPPPAKKDQGSSLKPDVGTPGVTLSADEKDLLDAINAARSKLGLNVVVPDPILMCAARQAAKVCWSSSSCGHVGSDGSWPNNRAEACGMNSQAAWKVNEIAAGPGFTDGADAVWGWSQSPGHWWGLTHPQATKIGVSATGDGCYWADFDCCIAGS